MTVDRRNFLATAAAAAVFLQIRPRAYAAEPKSVDDAALAELRKRFGDRLIAPTDARYEVARKVRNRDFDGVRPRALVLPSSLDEVRFALQWAVDRKVPVVPRGGGHSYIGQSTCDGLVIALYGMAATTVDKAAMTAEVGAGALNVDANVALLTQGVALPTGSCPSVGVAGLTLGGGIGFSSRAWGLMCDNLIGATLVVPSGEVLEVDEAHRPEVLWALRGGGGGQFGIVTSFRFRVHPVEPISEYEIRWPWSAADKVLDAWQRFAPDAPDALFSVCMLARGKSEPQLLSHGRFQGPASVLKKVLAPLVSAAKPSSGPRVYDTTLWASHVEGPKCAPDPSACHSWNHPQPGRYQQASYIVKSDFFARSLDDAGRATLIRGIEGIQRQAVSWGGIILDALGGAINRVPPDKTAYVHRGHRFQAEYVAHWNQGTAPAKVEANRAWMRSLYESMRPWASGECYQNYPDLDRADWKKAYYGDNLVHLERMKAMLDPGRTFQGRQVLDPVP
ncbi:MAG: FAD-binding oxidoreductase [Deltaproteobacteria bacterium]|nr:FAD-binding oxidoreductase [Deltaproteobacteria bacterium]